jgi:hypothetical protein
MVLETKAGISEDMDDVARDRTNFFDEVAT